MKRSARLVVLTASVYLVIFTGRGFAADQEKAPAPVPGSDVFVTDPVREKKSERSVEIEKEKEAVYPSERPDCIGCHTEITPGVVSDWRASAHARFNIDCANCHGAGHSGSGDAEKAVLPTPEICGKCHSRQVEQFKMGKHAKAWDAMKAMPTAHWQPMAMTGGLKGCGGCHKVGIKSEAEIKQLRDTSGGFGSASCDNCHTRHIFSKKEAQQPQACQTCHMGFDHAQWEMYSSSKHGVRYLLKQNRILPDTTAAPSCQTCHVINGSHENRTAWGFMALRLPLPEDPEWKNDRTVILQALGVLDPEGNVTPRFEVVKSLDLVRLTDESWIVRREAMAGKCNSCHSGNFARLELDKGDAMIRDADRVMAEAIRIVAGLYNEGIIPRPATYAYPFPDLLTFHDAQTPVEQKLFLMFMEYRMRAFQGAFHNNPDYAFWYGWSSLQRTLTEIRFEAADLRRKRGKKP